MGWVAIVPAYLAVVGAGIALWKAFRERDYSRFTLVIHQDTHTLNLALLNGGTQAVTVLQLSFMESVLPDVQAQVPSAPSSRRMEPIYHPGPLPNPTPMEAIAPLVVPARTAEVVRVDPTWNKGGRANWEASAADGTQYLLELFITVASGEGDKREETIALLRFAADGTRALWEPPLKPLDDTGGSYLVRLLEPRPWWQFQRRTQVEAPRR
jgi:hypothetical protein